MKRYASLRFENALVAGKRAETARTLRSAGAAVTSWSDAAGCTYARALLDAGARPEALATLCGARVDMPPLVVLRIVPRFPEVVPALAAALNGPGAPVGVVAVRPETAALVVAIAAHLTRVSFVLAVLDLELGAASGRRIEPVLPLEDEILTALAADLLGEPELDDGRLIETHLAPLLEAHAG